MKYKESTSNSVEVRVGRHRHKRRCFCLPLRLDPSSYIPSKAEWILIAVFFIGAIALIPQYVVLSVTQVGYLSLAAALLTLALKVFTTSPAPPY
jgi:hypothetical protein